jgi:hypothetical protein
MGSIIDTKTRLAFVALVLLGVILVINMIWPFVGILLRLWAHYNPRAIVLDEQEQREGENMQSVHSDSSQNLNGYWSLFRRVIRVDVRW